MLGTVQMQADYVAFLRSQLGEAIKYVTADASRTSPDPQITFFSRHVAMWTVCLWEARRRSSLLESAHGDYFGNMKVLKDHPETRERAAFEKAYPLVFPPSFTPKEEEILIEMVRGENMRIKVAALCERWESAIRGASQRQGDAERMRDFQLEMARVQNLAPRQLEENCAELDWRFIANQALKRFSPKQLEQRFIELKHPLLAGGVDWSCNEVVKLHTLAHEHGPHNWPLIARLLNESNKEEGLPHLRSAAGCLGEYSRGTRASRRWTDEEDARLAQAVST